MNRINYTQPRNSKLDRLPLGSVRAAGWIRQQLEIEAAGMSGHLDELEPAMVWDPFTTRHHEAKIGAAFDASLVAGWSAEVSGTYWIGFVMLAYTLDRDDLKEKATKWVDAVLAGQEEDGYIGGYAKEDDRNEDYNAWSQNWAMRALLAYYEATGRQDVLEACHKGLLWFVRNWADHFTEYAGPTLIESMVEVYLYTGDIRLVEWAEKFLLWHDANSQKINRLQDFANDNSPYNTIHAVDYGELVKNPALLYKWNGNQKYLDASSKGLAKVIDKCLQRTGAPCTNVEYLGPVGDTCESEYCNFETFEHTFFDMGAITGSPDYFDMAEKVVFNASQGAKKKDGRAIAYMTSPNQFVAMRTSSLYSDAADSFVYSACYRVACCPTHAIAVMPEYLRNMCAVDDGDALFVNCYGPCVVDFVTADGSKITVEETTEYPFKEDIEFTIHTGKPARMKLMLRIPGWCEGAKATVNGESCSVSSAIPGYFEIDRVWSEGDQIQLTLPMSVKAVDVDDSDWCMRYPIAIERGPLLFAYHLPEKWTVTEPVELNPHPDWPCYEVTTDSSHYYPTGLVLERKSLDEPSAFKVSYRDVGDANPWETSPVSIAVEARRAEYMYSVRMIANYEPLPTKSCKIKDEPEQIEMIPYGCTNLRISYFPALR